jgi:hypothetical protein
MVERRGDARFAQESLAHGWIERELRREHLDRYSAALMALDAAIDHGHAAAANLRFDEVFLLEERRHMAEKIVGHVALSGRAAVGTVQCKPELGRPNRSSLDVLQRKRRTEWRSTM